MNKSELISLLQHSFSSEITDSLSALLLPVLFFVAAPPAPEHHTFLGSTPVMSESVAWPTAGAMQNPAPTQNAEHYGEEITNHVAKDLPLSFIAQIDLTKAPASALPSTGRLLFYYDTIAGPFENGNRFARVIWDKGESPTQRPTPKALLEAEKAYIVETKEALANYKMPAIDDATIAIFKASGMTDAQIDEIINAPAPDLSNEPVFAPFIGPKQPMSLRAGVMLPSAMLHEFGQDPALKALYFGSSDASYAFQESYDTLLFNAAGPHVLGTPLPEQDDPRYDAATLALFGKQHLGQEWSQHKNAVFKEAQDWQLLFEVTLTTWLQNPNFEGTIYFLIHEQDLKSGDFNKAIAVYQQT